MDRCGLPQHQLRTLDYMRKSLEKKSIKDWLFLVYSIRCHKVIQALYIYLLIIRLLLSVHSIIISTMSSKTALVFRATGAQGRGVVHHLSKTGWNVHAYVSDPSTERALALKKYGEGVSLHKGTFDDRAAIEAAMKGCDVVFLVQMPSFTDDVESRDAGIILDVAKATGIKHIVHSTQVALNDPNVRETWNDHIVAPAVLGKLYVEEMVRESGIPWTFLRTGWFMTNITDPIGDWMYPGLAQGKFINSYTPDTVLGAVDPDDIGAFAAAAFNDPKKFTNHPVTVVSEMITVKEALSEIERASGKKLDIHYRTAEENEKEAANPFVIGQLMTGDLARLIDMDEVKSWGVHLTSFREFLQNNKDTVLPK